MNKCYILNGVIGILIIVLILSFMNTKTKYHIFKEGFSGGDIQSSVSSWEANGGGSSLTGTTAYANFQSGGVTGLASYVSGTTGYATFQDMGGISALSDYVSGTTGYANFQSYGGITGMASTITSSGQYKAWQSQGGITGFVNDVNAYGITAAISDFQQGATAFLAPISTSNSNSYVYDHTTKQNNVIIFYGVNNSTANVTNVSGTLQINVSYGNGNTETYIYSQMYDDQIIFISSANTSNSAVLVKTNNSMTLTIYSGGNTYSFYSNISNSRNELATYINEYYYGSTGTSLPISSYPTIPPSTYDYSNYMPSGIPKTAIPYGKEDMYILKSEVVPPVCPVCPPPVVLAKSYDSYGSTGSSYSNYNYENGVHGPPPPCPACDRCPEPIVDCKKVVKYKNGKGSDDYYDYSQYSNTDSGSSVNKPLFEFSSKTNLAKKGEKYTSSPPSSSYEDGPMPVLNSFSSFGL